MSMAAETMSEWRALVKGLKAYLESVTADDDIDDEDEFEEAADGGTLCLVVVGTKPSEEHLERFYDLLNGYLNDPELPQYEGLADLALGIEEALDELKDVARRFLEDETRESDAAVRLAYIVGIIIRGVHDMRVGANDETCR